MKEKSIIDNKMNEKYLGIGKCQSLIIMQDVFQYSI